VTGRKRVGVNNSELNIKANPLQKLKSIKGLFILRTFLLWLYYQPSHLAE